MGGGDSGSKVIGDKGGISDTYGDALCWNRNCKQIDFGAGSFHVFGQCGFGSSDGPKRWADCGGSCHFYGWLDGEGDIGENRTADKTATTDTAASIDLVKAMKATKRPIVQATKRPHS
jgi:hypothetical protein